MKDLTYVIEKDDAMEKLEGPDRGLYVFALYQGMQSILSLEASPSVVDQELLSIVSTMMKGIEVFLRVSYPDFEGKFDEVMKRVNNLDFQMAVSSSLMKLRMAMAQDGTSLRSMN